MTAPIPLPGAGHEVAIEPSGACDRAECLCRDAIGAGIEVVHYREHPESEVP